MGKGFWFLNRDLGYSFLLPIILIYIRKRRVSRLLLARWGVGATSVALNREAHFFKYDSE
jgi:hypothetical protein